MGIREEQLRLNRAADMPHRKLAGDNRLDARLESVIGRLFFEGKITRDEYESGVKYGNFALLYLETIDGPDPHGGKEWQRDGSRCNALPGAIEEINNEECERRAINFMAGRQIIRDSAGKPADKRWLAVVDRVAIYDEPLRDGELDVLRAGLRALCGRYFLRLVDSK